MKQNLIVILLILSMVFIPLVTSMLLDWLFIKSEPSRRYLVYFFMILEILAVVLVLLDYLKETNKN